jgi:hypothetical protein
MGLGIITYDSERCGPGNQGENRAWGRSGSRVLGAGEGVYAILLFGRIAIEAFASVLMSNQTAIFVILSVAKNLSFKAAEIRNEAPLRSE